MRNFSFPEVGFRFCDKSDIIGVYQGIYNFGRKRDSEFGVRVFFTYCGKMGYRGKYGVS
jgi:hypothetical protein